MSIGKLLMFSVLGFSASAWSHSPYLLPNAFDVSKRDHVTVQGSFTEEFFKPDVVMKSELYHVIEPDGKSVALAPVYGRDLALLEVSTTAEGTYRISSGLREGRTAKAVLINGEWEFIGRDSAPPAGMVPVDMKSLTRADVYVTRGRRTEAALSPSGTGLEFRAITHPNGAAVGTAAQFEVLFDGKRLPNQPVSVYLGDQSASTKTVVAQLRSNAEGRLSISLDKPGVYLAMARYRLDTKAPNQPALSYTYSVTFEAVE